MHKEADAITIVPGINLNWKGVFDLGDMYRQLKWWFDYEGFGDETKNFKEVKYVERIKPIGKQYEIRWICEKNVSDYFAYQIEITMLIFGVKDAEVNVGSKKVKIDRGEIDMRISSRLIRNRSGKWKKESFLKKIYDSFIVKDRIDGYKQDIYEKTYKFQDEVKKYLAFHKL